MRYYMRLLAREAFYAGIFLLVGLVFAPLLFYRDATLDSIWGDTSYTITAFDKFWDDLVRYREFRKVWWKIASPYVAFQIIRAGVWKMRKSREKVQPVS